MISEKENSLNSYLSIFRCFAFDVQKQVFLFICNRSYMLEKRGKTREFINTYDWLRSIWT